MESILNRLFIVSKNTLFNKVVRSVVAFCHLNCTDISGHWYQSFRSYSYNCDNESGVCP